MKVERCETFPDEYLVVAEYMTARFTSVEHVPDKELVRLYYNGERTGACIHLDGVDDFLEQLSRLNLELEDAVEMLDIGEK